MWREILRFCLVEVIFLRNLHFAKHEMGETLRARCRIGVMRSVPTQILLCTFLSCSSESEPNAGEAMDAEGGETGGSQAMGTEPVDSKTQAQELIVRLQKEKYSQNFARAPDWETPLLPRAGGPHGAFLNIYVNKILEDALAKTEPLSAWPIGSLIVKDGFRDGQGAELQLVSLMEKRGEGEWFWAEYNASLNLIVAGNDLSSCTTCHSGGSDQVLAFSLPQ